MLPFANFSYFFILLIISLPAIYLGLRSKPISKYTPIATAAVLSYTFSPYPSGLLALLTFVVFQLILAKIYTKFKKCFPCIVILALTPLLLTKIIPSQIDKNIGFLIGISYLTFKCLQVLFEVRDGIIKNISIKNYLNFILFFPTLSSGPIDRSRRFDKDYNKTLMKEEYLEYLHIGINKIFYGFLYKFIMAFLIKYYWLDTIGVEKTLTNALSYMYAYGLYLFFDFAGYSFFAIGFSYIFGIVTPENFNAPFLARNIRDFWNRWHMSLSFWFRDFIFMRFLAWVTRNKFIKSPKVAMSLGYVISFGIMGLWHGISKHYIIYGIYHGLLFSSYELFKSHPLKNKLIPNNNFGIALSIFITIHFVFFGLLIFSGWLIN